MPPEARLAPVRMFEAMERGELRALYVIGENPVQSEADQHARAHLLEGLELPRRAGHVPDRRPREIADVVLPGGRRVRASPRAR